MNALVIPHPDEVAAIRARVEAKALALQEEWLDGLYPRMKNPEMPDGTYLATGRDLYKYSGQEKKDNQSVAQGTGFTVNIVLPNQENKSITIEATALEEIDGVAPAIGSVADNNDLRGYSE